MPVKDKAKREAGPEVKRGKRSHAEHDDELPATRDRLEADEEETPHKNRLTEMEPAGPRSKHHRGAEAVDDQITPEAQRPKDPGEAAAEDAEEAAEAPDLDEVEPSAEDLQAEEATVQAAAGMVPRDEDLAGQGRERS